MAGFFSSDNWLWKPFDYIADLFIMSSMWLLTSLPIVTMGAATTAMYDCTAHCVRGQDKNIFGRYFRTFKREFVPSTVSLVFWALVLGGLYQLAKVYSANAPETTAAIVIMVCLLFLLTFAVGIFSWVFPLLSRFTFSVVQLNITAVKLAIANLPRTILLGMMTEAIVLLCVRLWVPALLLPELLMLGWRKVMEPVFKRYMPAEIWETEDPGEEEENE